MAGHVIHASEVTRSITLQFEFRGAKVMAARFWLAAQLCRLVGWVAGTGVSFSSSLD